MEELIKRVKENSDTLKSIYIGNKSLNKASRELILTQILLNEETIKNYEHNKHA